MGDADREMTLREWVTQLPERHRARGEYEMLYASACIMLEQKARAGRAEADLAHNSRLLARQCDLAREAEARAMRVEAAVSVFCAEVCGPGSEADGRGTAPECEGCPLGAVEKAREAEEGK